MQEDLKICYIQENAQTSNYNMNYWKIALADKDWQECMAVRYQIISSKKANNFNPHGPQMAWYLNVNNICLTIIAIGAW